MSQTRRDFLKNFWMVPLAVPLVGAAAVASLRDVEGGDGGNVIVRSGAKNIALHGNIVEGDIIIEPGTEGVIITNTRVSRLGG